MDIDTAITILNDWRVEADVFARSAFTPEEDRNEYTREIAGIQRTLQVARSSTLKQVIELLSSIGSS